MVIKRTLKINRNATGHADMLCDTFSPWSREMLDPGSSCYLLPYINTHIRYYSPLSGFYQEEFSFSR